MCVDDLDFEPNTINFAGLLRKNYPLKFYQEMPKGKFKMPGALVLVSRNLNK